MSCTSAGEVAERCQSNDEDDTLMYEADSLYTTFNVRYISNVNHPGCFLKLAS